MSDPMSDETLEHIRARTRRGDVIAADGVGVVQAIDLRNDRWNLLAEVDRLKTDLAAVTVQRDDYVAIAGRALKALSSSPVVAPGDLLERVARVLDAYEGDDITDPARTVIKLCREAFAQPTPEAAVTVQRDDYVDAVKTPREVASEILRAYHATDPSGAHEAIARVIEARDAEHARAAVGGALSTDVDIAAVLAERVRCEGLARRAFASLAKRLQHRGIVGGEASIENARFNLLHAINFGHPADFLDAPAPTEGEPTP